MIARCIHSTAGSLGVPTRGSFYSAATEFSLVVGKQYPILGLGLFELVLLALVWDESDHPNWLPVGLFDFDPGEIRSGWRFATFDGVGASGGDAADRWTARWGYAELVADDRHVNALIERDPVALSIAYGSWRDCTPTSSVLRT